MAGIVDSRLWIKVTALWSFHTIMFVYREANIFRPRAHMFVTTFTRCVQYSNIILYYGACFIVWLYYACSYTVALSLEPYPFLYNSNAMEYYLVYAHDNF